MYCSRKRSPRRRKKTDYIEISKEVKQIIDDAILEARAKIELETDKDLVRQRILRRVWRNRLR